MDKLKAERMTASGSMTANVNNPQTLTRHRRTYDDVYSITKHHAEAQRARRGWAVSRRTLRLCVNIFRERGLQANVAVTIGFGPKYRMRIGHKVLPILRFTPDSALSEAFKPHGTYASSASYPVSTHGKPSISARLHFFCNKIANGC